MRWFVGSVCALLLVWLAFAVSPYWALLDLAAAIEARDVARIADRVNFRAVRVSVAKQVAQAGINAPSVAAALGSPDATVAANTVALVAEPLLEQAITPEGLVGLLGGLNPDRVEPVRIAGRLRPNAEGFQAAFRLLRASRWRGFRNVYFAVPPEPGSGPEARLQMRLSRLRWRLVAIELTPASRQQLLDEAVRLYRERERR